MGGWSSSEEENRFQLSPTDFTPVNIETNDMPQEQSAPEVSMWAEPQYEQIQENYFYSKLGFRVGDYFDGEKNLYSKRIK